MSFWSVIAERASFGFGSLKAFASARLSSPGATLALSFCVAVFVFGLSLDFFILGPRHIDWLLATGADSSIYFFSFAFYRHAPWAFPIAHFDTLFHPVGTSLILMDGLPLVAVPLKLLDRILPLRFQFLGLWLLVCIWLQTFFAHRFLRVLKLPPLWCWVGAIVAATAPPFIGRFGHVALSSHFIILVAMTALCGELPGVALWLAPIVALWIHPYLFVIVLALSLTGQMRFAKKRGAPLRLALTGLGLIGSMWVLGYFGLKQTRGTRFEYYASDLSSLANSMGGGRLLPSRDLGNGPWEGQAYLGCGGLFLCAVLIAAWVVPSFRRKAGQNWWLLGACAVMALYSLSTAPHFLGTVLFRLERLARLIEPISSRFRSSGRFIWPLYYYLLFFGLAALYRLSQERRWLRFAAPALLALQLFDIWPGLLDKPAHLEMNLTAKVREVPEEIRSQLSPSTRLLIFMPPVKTACAGKHWRGPYQHLAWFALLNGLSTNANLGEGRASPENNAAVCEYTQNMYRYRRDHPEAIFIRDQK